MRIIVLSFLAVLVAAVPAGALPAESVHVSAVGLSFVPQAVTVAVGEPVTWNGILLGHTVTSSVSFVNAAQGQDDGAFDHPLAEGSAVTLAFAEPGVYTYFCELHHRSGMIGTVVVG